ncbi:MAG: alcohol dehydrogenase catalytic domain-containing protein, partial [Nitrososphaeraceae archaeon]
MKAARIIKPKESLQVQDLDLPKATGSQVVVKVRSSGVCHSDIHLWEGGYEGIEGQFLKATDRGVTYPLTPGHEIAGMIESLGEEAEKEAIDKNDKVIVYPWIGEGLCPACRVGEENLCDKPRSLGVYTEGGYAEYVLVPSYKYLVKIGDLDTDVASTLSCSALTAYGAVKNAELKPNDNVVIVGAGGGLGLMAVQLAKAVTGARIIALDLDQEKLKVARENGANEIVSPKDGDPAKRVMELTANLGADAIIDFVNASKTV